jgi:hypothetical protein
MIPAFLPALQTLTALGGSNGWFGGSQAPASAAPALTDTSALSTNYFPAAPMDGAMGFHNNMFGAPDPSQGGLNGMLSGVGGLQGISGIIGSLGGLYSAFQGAKLAKDSLAFQKQAYTKNLQNQTQSYNTALTDRARTRGVMEGQSSQQVDDYISQNKLSA